MAWRIYCSGMIQVQVRIEEYELEVLKQRSNINSDSTGRLHVTKSIAVCNVMITRNAAMYTKQLEYYSLKLETFKYVIMKIYGGNLL